MNISLESQESRFDTLPNWIISSKGRNLAGGRITTTASGKLQDTVSFLYFRLCMPQGYARTRIGVPDLLDLTHRR